MVIRKATREQIETALREVNLAYDTTLQAGRSAYGNTGIRPAGRGWSLTLKLQESTDPFHRHGAVSHDRESRTFAFDGCGKRMTYVCWHGHREFMRALYRLAPDATIHSGFAAYRGSEHFEATHRGSDRNIGNSYHPVSYSDACDCERGVCPSRRPGRVAEESIFAAEPILPPSYHEEHTVTPEETLAQAGIEGERWSDYNRKFNELLQEVR